MGTTSRSRTPHAPHAPGGDRGEDRTWVVDGVQLPAVREGSRNGPGRRTLARLLGVRPSAVVEAQIERRSLDARRRPPTFRFRIRVVLRGAEPTRRGLPGGVTVGPAAASERRRPMGARARPSHELRPVVVGTGPAGLFAALTLSRLGLPPLVLERGSPVDRRRRDVARFRREGALDPDSNVVYGEGGAGTFSDGKIYSEGRVTHARQVLETLVELGASPDILVDRWPHIGTDRLAPILRNLRQAMVDVEVRFEAEVCGLEADRGRLMALRLADGQLVEATQLILATGQNARDSYGWLSAAGVALEPRPGAVGVRIEHPQRLVDRWLYGGERRGDLPPGFYRVALRAGPEMPRPVHSFCMCPGGVIVAAPERDGRVVTNGMSGSRRSGKYANAALLVPVGLEDYRPHGADALCGLRFVDQLERRAFEAGGGGFVAPAQRADQFAWGLPPSSDPRCTYRPGVRPADLAEVLPAPVTASLRVALRRLHRRWPGFAGPEAVLVGVETRSSSLVRILRDDAGQSPGLRGVFPAGEGAGYAGGILSAAADGITAAERLVASL